MKIISKKYGINKKNIENENVIELSIYCIIDTHELFCTTSIEIKNCKECTRVNRRQIISSMKIFAVMFISHIKIIYDITCDGT
jgi:hypothetical protein